MTSPAPTPAERFATLLQWLAMTVAAMSGGDRLSHLLIAHIVGRIRTIKQGVARVVARLDAGTYAPRRHPAARRPPAVGRPRRPDTLPRERGWLVKLVPDAIGCCAQLEGMLQDAEVVAMLAAAPTALARPIRSLCWMLRVDPPALLKRPAKPRPPRKTAVAPAAAPEPPPPAPPAWMPRRTRWTLARIRGSPRPA